MPHPLDAADLGDRVRKALAGFLAEQAPRLETISEDLGPVSDAISSFLLERGKLLRPAFCYWGWRGAGGPDTDSIVTAASCLELLHACALVHDDVMDGSDTRRGRPALHRQFAARHRAAGWAGDPDRFGVAAAILAGDLCLVWADRLLHSSGLSAEALERAAGPYGDMRVELMAGQYLDVLEQAYGGGDIDRALRVARYKTAKYTVERPLQLGGALAGAPEELLRAYTSYGVPLGEAFQLRDDVLGVYGDPGQTGKPAGDDLREGKRTALVALALSRASAAERDLLGRLIGDPALDDAGVATLREVIAATGAVAEVERLIEARTGEALAALARAPVAAEARAVLGDLATAATTRCV